MATKIESQSEAQDLYQEDFYVWTERQADLLRAREFEALDLEHRSRLELELTPRLRQILHDELPRVYAITRRATERKLRLYDEDAAADALPATCPYTLDQITGDWWP